MLLSPPTATSPRVSSELEQARPQTSGEEELQLQLALAMSREVAEQVSARVGFPHVHAFIVTTTCLSLQRQLGFAPGGIGGEKKKKKRPFWKMLLFHSFCFLIVLLNFFFKVAMAFVLLRLVEDGSRFARRLCCVGRC